jgi:hypothetical protein
MQIRGNSVSAQDFRQPLHFPATGDADREVIKTYPPFAELVTGWGTGQRRAQHQAVVLADPEAENLARGILVDRQPQDALVEGASAGQRG